MKKETIRKLGIALAAILGLGALLYLSGLVAQLLINYEDWLHSGGMTGTAQIAPLQYHPLYCIRHAFTPAGLRAALLILTVGSGVSSFVCGIGLEARTWTTATSCAANGAHMALPTG